MIVVNGLLRKQYKIQSLMYNLIQKPVENIPTS